MKESCKAMYRVQKKEWPPTQYMKPLFNCFPKQFLKFLTEKVKIKLCCVRLEYKVRVNILNCGDILYRGIYFSSK